MLVSKPASGPLGAPPPTDERSGAARWARPLTLGLLALTGLVLVLVPARIVRGLASVPSPTVTVRTLSDDIERVTVVPLGGAAVPIDVDADSTPDIDVSVAITNVDFLPGTPIAPSVSITRDPQALNTTLTKRRSPPLEVEVIFGTFDPETSETDTASFGYETEPGGSIPATFQAVLLSGIESTSADPLEAAVLSPGYNGPIRMFSNVDTTSLFGAFDLGYDPLPERVGVLFQKGEEELKFRYEQASLIPEVDLDVRARVETTDELGEMSTVNLSSLIQRLPTTIRGCVRSAAAAGSFEYVASRAPADPGSCVPDPGTLLQEVPGTNQNPDILARFITQSSDGSQLSAVARIASLPSSLKATFPGSEAEQTDVSFLAPDPIGSIDFEVRNFLKDTDAPDLPGPLVLPPTDHLQFVSRGVGDDTRFAARGHVSLIREVSFNELADGSKVVHTELGDGVHPFRAGIDIEEAEEIQDGAETREISGGRFKVDATVTNLPADLTATFRAQDDTQPADVPLLIRYESSAQTDADAHVEIAPALDVGCRERGSTCVDAKVKHVPQLLQTTFASVGTATTDQGTLVIDSVPREGGAKPDILVDLDLAPAENEEGDPITVHGEILRFPEKLRAEYHVANDEPDRIELQALDATGAPCPLGGACAIGQVNFRLRNFFSEPGFGTDDLIPTDYLALVGRKVPTERFEVSGQTREIRTLGYRKVGEVAGVKLELGTGAPFRVHADLDTADETPPTQQIVDSLISILPNIMTVCFRSPTDEPLAAPIADPSGLTTACQNEPSTRTREVWGTVESTPFTVVYDATLAPLPRPIVQTIAKVLEGGSTPVGGGERQNPDKTTVIDSRIETLPRRIAVSYLPSKESTTPGVFGRPLKLSYEGLEPVSSVTADFTSRSGDSQCADPRPGTESLCAKVRLTDLPRELMGVIESMPDSESTRFRFEASPEAANTKIGCTGLFACPDFEPGVELTKVDNTGESPSHLLIQGAIEGLPEKISGRMDNRLKGLVPAPDKPAPELTKLAIQACKWDANDQCTDPLGAFAGVRFAARNYLVPDPMPADVSALDEFFHFVKREEAFRASAALKGFQGAVFTSPGDTVAVHVNTTPVARDIGIKFDMQTSVPAEDAKKILVDGTIFRLPPDLRFCFRSEKSLGRPTDDAATGGFCDAAPDPSTAIRIEGAPAGGVQKPDAVVHFEIEKPADLLNGDVTIVGLPSVMQATFDSDNIGFNKPDVPGFPIPANSQIDSVRFNVRNFRSVPPEDAFANQRFQGAPRFDDPATVPPSTPITEQFVSVIKTDASLQAKGNINVVREAGMFQNACPNDQRTPVPPDGCKRLIAKIGDPNDLTPDLLSFYLHILEGGDQTFVNADIDLPFFLEVFIDTESEGSDPTGPDPFALESNRPPLLQLSACDPSRPCSEQSPGPSPTLRGIFEKGLVTGLDFMRDTPPRDPLFTQPLESDPDYGLGGGAVLLDSFYDPSNPAIDDFATINTPDIPGAAADRYIAIRVGDVDPPACTDEKCADSEKVVRAKFKIPFPAGLRVGAPISLKGKFGDKEADDIAISLAADGFNGLPLDDFGRAVAILSNLQRGESNGGEIVLNATNLPGHASFKLIRHSDPDSGIEFVDAKGAFSREVTKLEVRKWEGRDDRGFFKIPIARGDVVVPNLRVNIHHIPTEWRARLYRDSGPPEPSDGGDPCEPTIYVVVNFQICIIIQYVDFSLDFHPSDDYVTAKRIDAVVGTKDDPVARVEAYDSINGGNPTPMSARATVRIAPLDIHFSLFLVVVNAVFDLVSEMDIHLFAVETSSFEVAFAKPATLRLEADFDEGPAEDGLPRGLFFQPIWDVHYLFAIAIVWIPVVNIIITLFELGPVFEQTPLPLPAYTCPAGGLLTGISEFAAIAGEINGFDMTEPGSTKAVLAVLKPPTVPTFDSLGGLITRALASLASVIMCTIDPSEPPVDHPIDPIAELVPSPPVPAAAPLADLNVGALDTVTMCGEHDYAGVTIDGTVNVGISPDPTLGVDGRPLCEAGFEGRLRIKAQDPAKKITINGTINADERMAGEPPITSPDRSVPPDPGAPPPPTFPAAQGTPASCGGGAGYGGKGGDSACVGVGGEAYERIDTNPTTITVNGDDFQLDVIYPGSPGAAGASAAGKGGGLISLEADRIDVLGTLTADGQAGTGADAAAATCGEGAGGGGGSGGGIFVSAERLVLGAAASVTATGGPGGAGKAGGGGGSGGRVKLVGILPAPPVPLPGQLNVAGGGAGAGDCDGNMPAAGETGTTFASGGITSRVFEGPPASPSEPLGVENTRIGEGALVTHWTNKDSGSDHTLHFQSAGSQGGSQPNHEIVLCFVHSPPDRNDDDPSDGFPKDGPRDLPEFKALSVPNKGENQSIEAYLNQLFCGFFGEESNPNGSVQDGTFSLSGATFSQGYVGFFTVAARRLQPGALFCFDGICIDLAPSCFDHGLFTITDFDEEKCQLEGIHEKPDFIVGIDKDDPGATIALGAAEGLKTDDSAPKGLATNGNKVLVTMSWFDEIADNQTTTQAENLNIYKQCLTNAATATPTDADLTCFGQDFAQGFADKIEWDLTPGDGEKTVTLLIEDMAGNFTTATAEIFVDTTKPLVTLTPDREPDPLTGWFNIIFGAPEITLTATETGDGVGLPASGATFIAFERETNSRTGYTGPVTMPEGTHKIFGIAVDKVGNEDTTPEPCSTPVGVDLETDGCILTRVDLTEPLTAVSVVPGAPDGQNGWYLKPPFVGATSIDPLGSGPARILVRTGPDLAAAQAAAPTTHNCPADSVTCLSPFLQVGQGTTVVCASAVDVAGNPGPQDCSELIKVDSNRPVTTATSPDPDGEHNWYVTTPPIDIASADVGGSGFGPQPGFAPCASGTADLTDLDVDCAGLWVSLDRGAFTLIPAAAFNQIIQEGHHNVRWFAEDAAGNREPIGKRSYQVDTSNPLSTFTTFPPAPNEAGWFRTEVRGTLTATDGKENAGIDQEHFGLDTPPVSTYQGSFPIPEGLHAATFFADDLSGRVEVPQRAALSVDVTHPDGVPTDPPGGPVPVYLASPIPLTFEVGDNLSPPIHTIIRIFSVASGLVRDIDAGPLPPGPGVVAWDLKDNNGDTVLPGLYYYRVLTVDVAGNTAMSGESHVFMAAPVLELVKGRLVAEFDLSSSGTPHFEVLPLGLYSVRATGMYDYDSQRAGDQFADAECSTDSPLFDGAVDTIAHTFNLYPSPVSEWQVYRYGIGIDPDFIGFYSDNPLDDVLDVYINDLQGIWVPTATALEDDGPGIVAGCNFLTHAYDTALVSTGQPTKFHIHDAFYPDNVGSIHVEIRRLR